MQMGVSISSVPLAATEGYPDGTPARATQMESPGGGSQTEKNLELNKVAVIKGCPDGASERATQVESLVYNGSVKIDSGGAGIAVVEAFAGVGAFLRACSNLGATVAGFIEWDFVAHDLLHMWWPNALHTGDFYHKEWKYWPPIPVLTAGFECSPYAKSGKQLGCKDSRSTQLADLAELAHVLQSRMFLGENVPQLLQHPIVLAQGDKAFGARGMRRIATMRSRHTDCGGASIRDRVFPYWEGEELTSLLPKLSLPSSQQVPCGTISQHLVPYQEVPEAQYLKGTLHLDEPTENLLSFPRQVGKFIWDDVELQRGSLVRIRRKVDGKWLPVKGRWRVMEDLVEKGAEDVFEIMRSDSRSYNPKKWIRRDAVAKKISQHIAVFSANHPSKSIRAFGEYPVRTAQLIAIEIPDGTGYRVRALLAQEVWSIQELSRAQLLDTCLLMGVHLPARGSFIPLSGWRETTVYRLAGNSIPQSMLKGPLTMVLARAKLIEGLKSVCNGLHDKATDLGSDSDDIEAPSLVSDSEDSDSDSESESIDERLSGLRQDEVLSGSESDDVITCDAAVLGSSAAGREKPKGHKGQTSTLLKAIIRHHLVIVSTNAQRSTKLLPVSVEIKLTDAEQQVGTSPFLFLEESAEKAPSIQESVEKAGLWFRSTHPDLPGLQDHIYHAGDFPESSSGSLILDRVTVLVCSTNIPGSAWREVEDLSSHLDRSLAIAAMGAASRHCDLRTVTEVSKGILEAHQSDPQIRRGITGATATEHVEADHLGSETIDGVYEARVAQMKRDMSELKEGLLAAEDDDWCKAAYLHSWADAVDCPSVENIPLYMQSQVATFKAPGLAKLLYPDTSMPASTQWCQSDPQQQEVPGFHPTEIEDILMPEALILIAAWIRRTVRDLQAYRDHGPSATRMNNKPLAIGQDLFQPQARGKIWDLRQWRPGLRIPLLDFQEEVVTKFDTIFLNQELRTFPDQELRSFMTAGVKFKADLDLQLVFLPHLMSLANGFKSVEEELKRLEKDGHYAFFKTIPFLPCRCQPQGSVPRVLEDRWRRILEGGGPRKETFDTEGKIVVPLNEASKLKPGQVYVSKEKRVTQAPKEKSPKWPRELKPKVSDVMVSGMILGHVAAMDELPVFAFQDDASDWFHQFFLSSQEYWKVCVLYLNVMEDSSSSQLHMYAVEYCLAMGLFQASNIAQRAANMIIDTFLKYAKIMEKEHRCELTPAQLGWMEQRSHLTARLHQDRLYDAAMYTDDSNKLVVGVARTIRLIRVWYFVTTSMNLKMAHARKRHVGPGVKFLGALMYFALGLLVFPEHKVIMALAMLRTAIMGDITLGAYRKLLGLLEHFLVLARGQRDIMHGVYNPLRDSWLNSADKIQTTRWVIEKMGEWRRLLLRNSGCSFSYALPHLSSSQLITRKVYYLFGDAARSESTGGIGGYFHGHWWHLRLTQAQLELKIPHLEFVALVVNIVLFVRLIFMEDDEMLKGVEIIANADGLAAVQNLLLGKSKAEVMWYIKEYLKKTQEYRLVKPILKLAHIYGMGNPLADAASRHYIELLKDMCLEMGVKPVQLQLPQDLKTFVFQVLACYRLANFAQQDKEALNLTVLRKAQKREREEFGPDLDSRQRGEAFRAIKAQADASDEKAPEIRLLDSTEKALTTAFICGNKNSAEQPTFVANFRSLPLGLSCSKVISKDESREKSQQRHSARSDGPIFLSGWREKTLSKVKDKATRKVTKALPTTAVPTSSGQQISNYNPMVINQLFSDSSEMVQAQSQQLLAILQRDDHPQALNPTNWSTVQKLCLGLAAATNNSGATSTNYADNLWWNQYWLPFTKSNGLPEWLKEPVNTAADRQRESLILALFFMHVAERIRPRRKAHSEAKPDSIKQVLQAVKRRHKKRGLSFSPGAGALAATAMNGLKHLYVDTHGAEALMPERKEPFCDGLDLRMIDLIGDADPLAMATHHPRIDRTSVKWRSISVMLKTTICAGFRKAELCGTFSKRSLSRQHLSWVIAACGAQPILTPSAIQLSRLAPGDYAMLRPPVMKNDQFGERYMAFPIYLKWDSDDVYNAAAALAQMEMDFPVLPAMRSSIPLFFESFERGIVTPFMPQTLDAALRLMLSHLVGPAQASRYSWHSFRITLACSLMAANYPEGVIQRMCRWKSVESLKAYARLDSATYMETLAKVRQVRLEQTQTSRLLTQIPQINADGQWQLIQANIPHLERMQVD